MRKNSLIAGKRRWSDLLSYIRKRGPSVEQYEIYLEDDSATETYHPKSDFDPTSLAFA